MTASLKTNKEVICLLCYYRWYLENDSEGYLRDVTCPICKRKGFVINTGETTATFGGMVENTLQRTETGE